MRSTASRRAGLRLLREVAPASGRRRLREVPAEPAATLAARLVELADALEGGRDEIDAVAERSLRLAADVAACLEADDDNRVVWAEPDLLAWAPIDVGARARGAALGRRTDRDPRLGDADRRASDFGFVRERLGLREADEIAVGSPYDFRSQALLYLPRGLPDPRADDAARARGRRGRGALPDLGGPCARADELLSRAGRGRRRHPRPRALTTCSSRARRRASACSSASARRSPPCSSPPRRSGRESTCPGESLSLLVIDKLPFAAPGDPLVEARCERIDALGGDWFREYSLPSAVLQLRQGFGRLIRSHADRGVIAILDPRVRTKPLRARVPRVAAALPGDVRAGCRRRVLRRRRRC